MGLLQPLFVTVFSVLAIGNFIDHWLRGDPLNFTIMACAVGGLCFLIMYSWLTWLRSGADGDHRS